MSYSFNDLKALIQGVPATNKHDIYAKERFHILMSHNGEDCLHRSCFNDGHITGSALLIDPTGRKVLMNHHKSLDKWLCFGGHADGEADILAVAIRETMEESGITSLKPVFPDILDLDIHKIPENKAKDEPEHFHYDVRFLLQLEDTADLEPVVSAESNELKWCGLHEAVALVGDNMDMKRLLSKWPLSLMGASRN